MTKPTFKSFLLENAKERMRVEKPFAAAVEISLDLVLAAYLQLTKQVPAKTNYDPIPEIVDLNALQVAKRVVNGEMVVIYNPAEVRYYFCSALNKNFFAVFYAISQGHNIYGVMCNSKDALIELGITGQTTSDLSIISKIFDFETPEVIKIPVPATPVAEQEIPPMTWYSVERQPAKVDEPVVTTTTATETTVVVVRAATNNQMVHAMKEAGIVNYGGSKPAAASVHSEKTDTVQ